MSKTTVISARVDEDLLAILDRLATAYERSRAWVVHKLLVDAAKSELRMLEDIEAGIADSEAGRVIEHEDFIKQLEALFPDHVDSKAA